MLGRVGVISSDPIPWGIPLSIAQVSYVGLVLMMFLIRFVTYYQDLDWGQLLLLPISFIKAN